MFEYEEAIGHYVQELINFIAAYELPHTWFKYPDHIAVKAADGLMYEYMLQDLLPDAQSATEVTMDGRRLASLQLMTSQPIDGFGTVSWLEVMEPRREKIGKDLVGVEHMEFYYPEFDEIKDVLEANAVGCTAESNPSHDWMTITINDQGQELKLNNRTLAEIVEQDIETGKAHVL